MGYVYRGTKTGKNDPWQAPNRRPQPKNSTFTPSPCGTDAGYKQHLYYREPPCTPCRTATRDYTRAWRAANNPNSPRPKPRCGTSSGATAHYKKGEKPCQRCRKALNADRREQRAKKKATTT